MYTKRLKLYYMYTTKRYKFFFWIYALINSFWIILFVEKNKIKSCNYKITNEFTYVTNKLMDNRSRKLK